jgi:hypothetical protein
MQESQAIKSKRFAFVTKEDYVVDLEYNETFAILHLPFVKKFSKSTYLDMLDEIKGIVTFLKDQSYEHVWLAVKPEDTLISKFVKKLGFNYKGTSDNLDVYLYEGNT